MVLDDSFVMPNTHTQVLLSSVGSEVYGLMSNVCTYSYLPNSALIASISNTVGGALCAATTRTYEEHRNLLTAIENASVTGTVSRYAYVNDAAGRRTSVTMTGPAFEIGSSFNAYAYNERSELIQAKRCFGTDLEDTTDEVTGQGYAYGYDLIGNRTNAYDGAVSGTDARRTYTANALNQYVEQTVPARANIMGTAETGTVVTVNNQATSRFGKYFQAYAGVTNSSSAAYPLVTVVGVLPGGGTNGTDVVSTSSGHVFVAKTPEQFSYDDDGNLLQDGRWSYEWDAENRLIGMETRTNLPAAVPRLKLSFAYDYMSRRVTKTVTSDDSSFIPHTSSFLYDGWAMIRESKVQGLTSNVSHYTYGLDLSGTLQGAGTIGGLLSRSEVSGLTSNVCFYAYDANGNVTDLVGTNGEFLAQYQYDPYGNTIAKSGELADVNPFRFSTKYTDSETGLLYYGYRYSQPETGRWVNRDPIGEMGGINAYEWCQNDGVNGIDKLGLLTDIDRAVLLYAMFSRRFFTPPMIINSHRVGITEHTFEIVTRLEEQSINLCPCNLSYSVDENVRVQTIHLFSLGQIAVGLRGSIVAENNSGRYRRWVFRGTATPRDEPFDFLPWPNGRGLDGEIVDLIGLFLQLGGVLNRFDINFTGPVNIVVNGVVSCPGPYAE